MTAKHPGRPPMPEHKRSTWECKLRMTPAEGEIIRLAAEAEKLDVGRWLRKRMRHVLAHLPKRAQPVQPDTSLDKYLP